MSANEFESPLLAEVRHVFRESLGVEPVDSIGPSTRFFADLGLASIDAVVLGEALQTRLGRPLPFHTLMADLGLRADRDLTIGELLAFLELHQ